MLCLPETMRVRALSKLRGDRRAARQPRGAASCRLPVADFRAPAHHLSLNPRMAGRWVRQGHRRFGRRSPLSIILRDGEGGLIAVLSELDCVPLGTGLTGSPVHGLSTDPVLIEVKSLKAEPGRSLPR